jgi:hypothetical protein
MVGGFLAQLMQHGFPRREMRKRVSRDRATESEAAAPEPTPTRTPLPRYAPSGANVAIDAAGSIEIALAGDVRLTLRGRVDVKGLRAVLAALRSS